MKLSHPLVRPLLIPLAGVLLYLAERVLGATPLRWPLAGLGLIALGGVVMWTATHWRAVRTSNAASGKAWAAVLAPQGALILAVCVYYLAEVVPAVPPGPNAPVNWAGVLQFAWALLALGAVVVSLFAEIAIWSQGATLPDPPRILRATTAGTNLALSIVLVVTLAYTFNRLPWQWDVAYFKTTDPSPATRQALAASPEPLRVVMFYPEINPVGHYVSDYFQQLRRLAPAQLELTAFDADLNPREAEASRAPGNGSVVLRRGERNKVILMGLDLARARAQLRRLDSDVMAAIIELSRPPKPVYLTIGHGERNEQGRGDGHSGMGSLLNLLSSLNFVAQPLGFADGLGRAVPDDAALVIVAGPTAPFSAAEAESLRRYLARGGRMLVLLEPRPARPGADPLLVLLAEYGVKFENVVQANSRVFARRTFTQSDHTFLATVSYGTHPAAQTVSRFPSQNIFFAQGAGALRKGKAPAGLELQAVVNTMPGTWGDKNGNFRLDPPEEVAEQLALALAVGPTSPTAPTKDGKPELLVFSDVDAVSDTLMQSRANLAVFSDSLAWLAGEPPPGLPGSEEDLPIQHAKPDDWLWFYLPVVGVPALVLLVGLLALGRTRLRFGRPA
jgi:hypothetical protein